MEYDKELPDYGDLMKREDWMEGVTCGMFTDYDGSGCPVKNGYMADVEITPSMADMFPADATHIMWFNR